MARPYSVRSSFGGSNIAWTIRTTMPRFLSQLSARSCSRSAWRWRDTCWSCTGFAVSAGRLPGQPRKFGSQSLSTTGTTSVGGNPRKVLPVVVRGGAGESDVVGDDGGDGGGSDRHHLHAGAGTQWHLVGVGAGENWAPWCYPSRLGDCRVGVDVDGSVVGAGDAIGANGLAAGGDLGTGGQVEGVPV
jgi:hypothetical protein